MRNEDTRTIAPVRALAAETLNLERVLSAMISQAHGLTAAEIELVWQTAPPRMAIPPPAGSRLLPCPDSTDRADYSSLTTSSTLQSA